MAKMSGVDLGDRPNFYFEANNRNKRGITARSEEARGARDRLPAGREVRRLRAELPQGRRRRGSASTTPRCSSTTRKLIYATATGYGPEGPESGDPSFDQLGLARSGIMLAAGEPDMPPLAIAGGIADQMGAIMLAYGVLAALLARERFGIGQEVDALAPRQHDGAAGPERRRRA